MSDITMCGKESCKARKSCYRYTAPVSEYHQSYFMDDPEENEHGSCEHFVPNDHGKYGSDNDVNK